MLHSCSPMHVVLGQISQTISSLEKLKPINQFWKPRSVYIRNLLFPRPPYATRDVPTPKCLLSFSQEVGVGWVCEQTADPPDMLHNNLHGQFMTSYNILRCNPLQFHQFSSVLYLRYFEKSVQSTLFVVGLLCLQMCCWVFIYLAVIVYTCQTSSHSVLYVSSWQPEQVL